MSCNLSQCAKNHDQKILKHPSLDKESENQESNSFVNFEEENGEIVLQNEVRTLLKQNSYYLLDKKITTILSR